MSLTQRQYNISRALVDISDYRHSFNGMEKDDEVKGDGNSYDFGARIYDPRVGRWLSIDPQSSRYPSQSPYSFVTNSPLKFIDPDGEKVIIPPGSQEEVMGYLKELGLEKAYRINRNDKLKVNRFWALTHRGQITSTTDKKAIFKGINKEIRDVLHTTFVHVVDESPWMVHRPRYEGLSNQNPYEDGGSGSNYEKAQKNDPAGSESAYVIVGDGNADVYDYGTMETFDTEWFVSRSDIIIDPNYIQNTCFNGQDGGAVQPSEAATFVHLLLDDKGSVEFENASRRLLFSTASDQRKGDDTDKDQGNYNTHEMLIIPEGEELDKLKSNLKTPQ